MSPGGVTEIVHFFIAEYSDAQRTHRGGGVEDEDIDVLEFPLPERWRWCVQAKSGMVKR